MGERGGVGRGDLLNCARYTSPEKLVVTGDNLVPVDQILEIIVQEWKSGQKSCWPSGRNGPQDPKESVFMLSRYPDIQMSK